MWYITMVIQMKMGKIIYKSYLLQKQMQYTDIHPQCGPHHILHTS